MTNEQLASELRKAIGAHGAWKLRLRTAAATGSSTQSAQDAGNCCLCDFGKWLTDPMRGGGFAATVQHRVLSRIHNEFHHCAGRVVAAIESKDTVAANQLLDQEFAQLSEHLVSGLNKWISEARQGLAA